MCYSTIISEVNLNTLLFPMCYSTIISEVNLNTLLFPMCLFELLIFNRCIVIIVSHKYKSRLIVFTNNYLVILIGSIILKGPC